MTEAITLGQYHALRDKEAARKATASDTVSQPADRPKPEVRPEPVWPLSRIRLHDVADSLFKWNKDPTVLRPGTEKLSRPQSALCNTGYTNAFEVSTVDEPPQVREVILEIATRLCNICALREECEAGPKQDNSLPGIWAGVERQELVHASA